MVHAALVYVRATTKESIASKSSTHLAGSISGTKYMFVISFYSFKGRSYGHIVLCTVHGRGLPHGTIVRWDRTWREVEALYDTTVVSGVVMRNQ